MKKNKCFDQKIDSKGSSDPAPGLYTCILPPFSKPFFSKIAWPIKAKHVKPPWEGGKEVFINCPCHMSKMATTPIYGKNHNKSSPTELIVI